MFSKKELKPGMVVTTRSGKSCQVFPGYVHPLASPFDMILNFEVEDGFVPCSVDTDYSSDLKARDRGLSQWDIMKVYENPYKSGATFSGKVKRGKLIWSRESPKKVRIHRITGAGAPRDWLPVVYAHWEMIEERKLDGACEVRRTGRMIPMCTHCRHADPDFKTCFLRCPNCGAVMVEEVQDDA